MSGDHNQYQKPEQMINGLTEEQTAQTKSVSGLSQPEPKPVAFWRSKDSLAEGWDALSFERAFDDDVPLYTAPPQVPQIKQRTGDCLLTGVCAAEGHSIQKAQREWQGLTDEDRQEIERWIEFKEAGGNEPVPTQKIITYVEAKLKEKGN